MRGGVASAIFIFCSGLIGVTVCLIHWFGGMWAGIALWSVVFVIVGWIGISVELERRD